VDNFVRQATEEEIS
jgi:hypothetical protein